ncbi:hypothetical protein BKA80DRAFT_259227 [Phyllosticta citrichinensis]
MTALCLLSIQSPTALIAYLSSEAVGHSSTSRQVKAVVMRAGCLIDSRSHFSISYRDRACAQIHSPQSSFSMFSILCSTGFSLVQTPVAKS